MNIFYFFSEKQLDIQEKTCYNFFKKQDKQFHIMKSLYKIFDILEFVVLQNGRTVTPSETARACSLNVATCTRIMKELASIGYLEQISRMAGYVPGPMTVSLSTRKNSYSRLAAAAGPMLKKMAAFSATSAVLAVLNGEDRYMIAFHSEIQGWTPWKQFRFSGDLESAATAQVLLAVSENRKMVRKNLKDSHGLLTEKKLEEIRKSGYTRCLFGKLMVYGFLIDAPGYPPSAFGFSTPLSVDCQKAEDFAMECRKEILNALTDTPAHAPC